MKELTIALRSLIRERGYSILSILTLAAGIGAGAAVFSLLDAVYFRPLPLRDPDRLVEVSLSSPKATFGLLSYLEFQDVFANAGQFEQVVAIGSRGVTLRRGSDAELLLIDFVSGNYFDALGVPVHLGRGLGPEDESPGATTPLVVVNHHLWRERLAARPDVIGSTIQLNDTLFTVVGVTAPGCSNPPSADRFGPACPTPR